MEHSTIKMVHACPWESWKLFQYDVLPFEKDKSYFNKIRKRDSYRRRSGFYVDII